MTARQAVQIDRGRGRFLRFCTLATLLLCSACSARKEYIDPDQYYQYDYYYQNCPKTVIILPARNLTTDAEASYFFMSTAAKPLIERGYYVLPCVPVQDVLIREGVGLDEEAWEIEPKLLHRYFGADAVLYVTIDEWDTKYSVVASSVIVGLDYRMVDTRTGEVLWEESGRERVSSTDYIRGSGSGLGALIALGVHSLVAAGTAVSTEYVDLASELNQRTMAQIPPGVYHPEYELLQNDIDQWKNEKEDKP